MGKETGGVLFCSIGQIVPVIWVKEGIALSPEEGLVCMHAAAVLAKKRFWHERGVYSVLPCNLLDRYPVSHHRVCHGECVSIPEVYLMLRMGHLMMRILDPDIHRLKGKDGLPSQVLGSIHRIVKVTAGIKYLGRFLGSEIEELKLRTEIKRVTLFTCLLDIPSKDIPGISLVWSPVRLVDVTEHTCNGLFLRPPGQEDKCCGVWTGNHIALINTGKTLD
ncbi:hypothetical protein BMS3Bbin07_00224 [bacterium BMS3Bbin07]|nr:hypothetical protein BMS3Bbin07_00224 [bacterium BMS3Bbin07]